MSAANRKKEEEEEKEIQHKENMLELFASCSKIGLIVLSVLIVSL